jgi:hypothetical protein
LFPTRCSFFLSLAVLFNGCGPAEVSEQEILNGNIDPKGYRQSVEIQPMGCSGSLITNSLVLTARHCIADDGTNNPMVPVTGATNRHAGSMTVQMNEQKLDVAAAFWLENHDVAVLVMAEPFWFNQSQSGFQRSLPTQSLRVGDLVQCHGRGHNAIDANGVLSGSGTLRSAVFQIDGFESGDLYRILKNSSGQMTLPGDSGGGCFLNEQLVGVHSRGDRTTRFKGTRVSQVLGQINTIKGRMNQNWLKDGLKLRQLDGGIFIIRGGAPLPVRTMTEYNAHFSAGELIPTIPLRSPWVPRDRTLLREVGDGTIYVVLADYAFPVFSMDDYNGYTAKYPGMTLQSAPAGSMAFLQQNAPRNFVLIRDWKSGAIWFMEGGRRRHIQSLSTYEGTYKDRYPLFNVPSGSANRLPLGTPIP